MEHGRRPLSCGQLLPLIGALLLGATAGCLSLGGRTTYVHEKPETKARLRALEIRIDALEQVIRNQQMLMPGPVDHGVATGVNELTAPPADGSY
jgi:hypothetical protein